MSSTTATSSNFQLIVDALADYATQTGIDLTGHPFAEQIQNCDSANAIIRLLQDKENEFKTYRNKHRKLINCLKPVVQFLHVVSGTLGEGLVLVSTTELICFL
jgi:fungal STAND N-terminal Goodbye domain